MGSAAGTIAPALIDTGNAPEIFVSGIARIEQLPGGNIRAVVYSDQESEGGTVERMVVLRIIAHKSMLPRAIRQATEAIAVNLMSVLN